MNIIDSFVAECKKGTVCPFMPPCCDDYIREINIYELKKKKAYFIWEEKGRKHNFQKEMMEDYFEACDNINIMLFCDKSQENINNCNYYKKLSQPIKSKSYENEIRKSYGPTGNIRL